MLGNTIALQLRPFKGGIKNLQKKCTASLLVTLTTGLEIRREKNLATREKNLKESLLILACHILSNNDSCVN